jgi:hypothetical protein
MDSACAKEFVVATQEPRGVLPAGQTAPSVNIAPANEPGWFARWLQTVPNKTTQSSPVSSNPDKSNTAAPVVTDTSLFL